MQLASLGQPPLSGSAHSSTSLQCMPSPVQPGMHAQCAGAGSSEQVACASHASVAQVGLGLQVVPSPLCVEGQTQTAICPERLHSASGAQLAQTAATASGMLMPASSPPLLATAPADGDAIVPPPLSAAPPCPEAPDVASPEAPPLPPAPLRGAWPPPLLRAPASDPSVPASVAPSKTGVLSPASLSAPPSARLPLTSGNAQAALASASSIQMWFADRTRTERHRRQNLE